MSHRAHTVAAAWDGKAQGTHELATPDFGLYQWVSSHPAHRVNERLQLVRDVRNSVANCIRHGVDGPLDPLSRIRLMAHLPTISAHIGAC
jgi:hypothetical protein